MSGHSVKNVKKAKKGTGTQIPVPTVPKSRPPTKPQTYRPPPPSEVRLSKPTPLSAPRLARARRWPLFLAWSAAGGLSFYGFYLYTSLTRPREHKHEVPSDVSSRYDVIAPEFDADVNRSEFWLGIRWLRKRLLKRAEGDVLELSAGTGRNINFYNLKKCSSVTLLDLSGPMLEIAKQKWRETHPAYKNIRFLTQSALEPIPGPPAQYDTTISTMSLCSTPEPVEQLRHMASLTKPTGKILLLEHGRSHYKWLDTILDNLAPERADKYGCWWNKDVGKIVEESGIELVKVRRWHFGTTWFIEARPRQPVMEEGKLDEKDKRDSSRPVAGKTPL